eukprot:s2655_g4.t1
MAGAGASRAGEVSAPDEETQRATLVASPGLGDLQHDVGADGMREQIKPPTCFTSALKPSEEVKSGATREYPPEGDTLGTTSFYSRECGELTGQTVVGMGRLLNLMLDDIPFQPVLHSKPKPSGNGQSCIFPLPLSSDIIERSRHPQMVRATCRALNLLYGETTPASEKKLSAACARALEFVVRCVDSMGSWDECFPPINFDIFFRSKGIDYRGEEVRVAQRFSWRSISPALPPEVGGVSLLDFCTLGTRFYVENFSAFLVPVEKQFLGRLPSVMVQDSDWSEICQGLIDSRVCGIIPLDEVYHIQGRPLLGGLFGVGKGEVIDGLEIQRLIMNFVPLNENCRPVNSDIATLPGISGLTPFMLEGGELALISSEDIRCFFYLFQVPPSWFRFLGFNKEVPAHLVPPHWHGRACVLHARVLPMGFRNSVGIAQHIHRNLITRALSRATPPCGGEKEMRKDRGATHSSEVFRIYLDNFDVVKKVDPSTAALVEGTPGLLSLVARQAYSEAQLPRHPKKSACQQRRAEVQGAILDGDLGVAYPKPAKVALYVGLALELLRRGAAAQREMQVVCGGFVYFCLFRRPLLSALNAVWKYIESFKGEPPVVRLALPTPVRLELVRFCGLLPLARMDFRLGCQGMVTASDASTSGGGACVSKGLTAYGVAAANASVRGDVPEQHDFIQVLSVGLFDGVSCLRMACDVLGLPMAGHISVEKSPEARRVVEAAFADTIFLDDVAAVDELAVQSWADKFSQVGLVLLGAGPPCQGVSGLNADKRGALKDERSCLFQHVPRIRSLLRQHFPWAQVKSLMESVASMSQEDREVMSEAFGTAPYQIDAAGVCLAHRPRLYWCDWELVDMEGARVSCNAGERPSCAIHSVILEASLDYHDYLEPGWRLQHAGQRLPTFTTSRPSAMPGRRPAGLQQCQAHEKQRWASDQHRFPPYQYKDSNCIINRRGEKRIASLLEREVIMGMPAQYTQHCLPKNLRGGSTYNDVRLTLVGNAWCVQVVAWIIGCLTGMLGLSPWFSPQQVVQACRPGGSGELQRLLIRPPVRRELTVPLAPGSLLVKKLAGLVSIKGEDLLLQASSEQQVKYQRLRASLPSKLWRLLKTWSVNEIPNRAPPLPEVVVHAMAGHALLNSDLGFALSLLVGFYSMLRTGELLGLSSQHISAGTPGQVAVLSLGVTKGGQRQGALESATLGVVDVVKLLLRWKKRNPPNTPMCLAPHKWRARFAETLKALKLEAFGFRPYSLRRGGATHWFRRHGSMDKLMVQGRPQMLPGGCWDVWRPGSALSAAAPRVFAAPMTAVSPRWREEAAKLFEKGWTQEASQKTIRYLLQCDQDPLLLLREQRRKKRPNLILWLLWQETPAKKGEVGSILSVAILSRQRYTSKGPLHLQGGMVLEYISVEPGTGAKAYWLVQAAEEVALLMGHTELFSACDLNQRGKAFDGRAKPALEAHRRWGFEDTDQKEWTDRRFEVYSAGCNVRYMGKQEATADRFLSDLELPIRGKKGTRRLGPVLSRRLFTLFHPYASSDQLIA